MAWYNAILGGGSTPTNGLQSSSTSSTYPSGLMNAVSTSTSLSSSQAGSILAVNGGAGQSYWGSLGQASNPFPDQSIVYTLMNYAQAIGWQLSHHHLPVGVTSDDPKISLLKLATIGEIVKDVGVRTSDTDFYIMREPSA